MKKLSTMMILAALSVSLLGCGNPCEENVITKLEDSIATIGKSGLEKDRILAERAAERAGECAKQAGGDIKKSLGF